MGERLIQAEARRGAGPDQLAAGEGGSFGCALRVIRRAGHAQAVAAALQAQAVNAPGRHQRGHQPARIAAAARAGAGEVGQAVAVIGAQQPALAGAQGEVFAQHVSAHIAAAVVAKHHAARHRFELRLRRRLHRQQAAAGLRRGRQRGPKAQAAAAGVHLGQDVAADQRIFSQRRVEGRAAVERRYAGLGPHLRQPPFDDLNLHAAGGRLGRGAQAHEQIPRAAISRLQQRHRALGAFGGFERGAQGLRRQQGIAQHREMQARRRGEPQRGRRAACRLLQHNRRRRGGGGKHFGNKRHKQPITQKIERPRTGPRRTGKTAKPATAISSLGARLRKTAIVPECGAAAPKRLSGLRIAGCKKAVRRAGGKAPVRGAKKDQKKGLLRALLKQTERLAGSAAVEHVRGQHARVQNGVDRGVGHHAVERRARGVLCTIRCGKPGGSREVDPRVGVGQNLSDGCNVQRVVGHEPDAAFAGHIGRDHVADVTDQGDRAQGAERTGLTGIDIAHIHQAGPVEATTAAQGQVARGLDHQVAVGRAGLRDDRAADSNRSRQARSQRGGAVHQHVDQLGRGGGIGRIEGDGGGAVAGHVHRHIVVQEVACTATRGSAVGGVEVAGEGSCQRATARGGDVEAAQAVDVVGVDADRLAGHGAVEVDVAARGAGGASNGYRACRAGAEGGAVEHTQVVAVGVAAGSHRAAADVHGNAVAIGQATRHHAHRSACQGRGGASEQRRAEVEYAACGCSRQVHCTEGVGGAQGGGHSTNVGVDRAVEVDVEAGHRQGSTGRREVDGAVVRGSPGGGAGRQGHSARVEDGAVIGDVAGGRCCAEGDST